MSLTLPPRLESLVRQKVEDGLYESPGQVMEEALLLLDERDRLRQRRLEELRQDIAIGLEQLERGEYVILDEEEVRRMNAEGRQRLEARRKQA